MKRSIKSKQNHDCGKMLAWMKLNVTRDRGRILKF